MKITNILFVFILIMINSCKSNKNEYIEITTGLSMNPFQPRIGVIINSNDSIYICKEIINKENNDKTKHRVYKYYSGTNKIDFNKYKKDVKLLFNDTIIFSLPEDAQIEKLEFSIDGIYSKRFLTSSILNKEQNEIINKLKDLIKNHSFVEIPYHKFSRDLLDYQIPDPPYSK